MYRPFGDLSGTFFHSRRSRLLKTGFFRAGKRAENRKENNPAVLSVRFEFRRKERDKFWRIIRTKKFSAFVGGRKDQGSAG